MEKTSIDILRHRLPLINLPGREEGMKRIATVWFFLDESFHHPMK